MLNQYSDNDNKLIQRVYFIFRFNNIN